MEFSDCKKIALKTFKSICQTIIPIKDQMAHDQQMKKLSLDQQKHRNTPMFTTVNMVKQRGMMLELKQRKGHIRFSYFF